MKINKSIDYKQIRDIIKIRDGISIIYKDNTYITISNKIIKVQYNLFVSHDNHPQYFIVHSWDNSSWVKSPRGGTTGAAQTWGDANSQYPHGAGGYDADNNNVEHVQCNAIWTDSTSSNTTLYTRLHWQSQNDTTNIYINRNVNHGTTHGAVMNSSGSIYIYQG